MDLMNQKDLRFNHMNTKRLLIAGDLVGHCVFETNCFISECNFYRSDVFRLVYNKNICRCSINLRLMLVYRFVRDLMKVVPINSVPALRFVPGLRSRYLELCNTHDRMMKFLNDALDDSLRGAGESDAEVSFASTYRDAENTKYDRTELLYILRDLIVAGTETSMTSLRWALIELANHPELQVCLRLLS
jgi:cytochrome P450